MMRIALVAAALAFAASMALTPVPSAHVPATSPRAVGSPVFQPAIGAPLPAVIGYRLGRTASRPAQAAPTPRAAGRAATEYVVMIMASLGLIVLGVAVRRRRY